MSPHSAPAPLPESRPLFSANQILLAAVLGSAAGGCILLSLNERRLGRRSQAAWTLAVGFIVTVLLGMTERTITPD